MNFDLLPREIKCHIFSLLSPDVLNVKVAIVCKQWQALTRNRRVVKHIEIDQRFDSKAIIRYLTTYNRARSLKITKVFKSKWILRIPINYNLRLLELDQCRFDYAILPFLPTRFPMISTLKLSYCTYSIPEDCIRTSTRTCSFGECESDCLQFFAESCHRLEEVDTTRLYTIQETSFQTLLNFHGSTLKKLSLCGYELTDNNFVTLSQCPLIEELALFNLLGMTDCQLLSIKKLSSLRKLSMSGMTKVSENAITELFTEPPFPHLHSICLQLCKTSDDVVDSLSKSYPNLKSLEITVCMNKITTASVFSIIRNCSVLEHLNIVLSDNITEYTLSQITSCLQHRKYLYRYFVSCKKIGILCRLQLTRRIQH